MRANASADGRGMRQAGLMLGVYHGAGNGSAGQRGFRRHGKGLRQSEAKGMEIADWRKKIDELDEQIVRLICKRAEAAHAIGELKHKAGLPVYEPGREQTVFEHVKAVNPGPLADAEIVDVYQRIIDVMRTLQKRES